MKKITLQNVLFITLFYFTFSISIKAQQFTEHTVSTQLSSPREFSTGDIDGDGFIDIIVPENTNSSISVFYGTGNLSNYTFGRYSLVDPSVGGNMKPWTIVIMDIDNDNANDIVFSNYANTTNATDGVYWMRNTGNRNFSSVQLIKFHDRCRGIHKANFDTDAKEELVIAGDNNSGGNLKILDISTTGTPTDLFSFTVDRRPLHILSVDTNQDQVDDQLIYTHFGAGNEMGALANRTTNGVKLLNDPLNSAGFSLLITNQTTEIVGTRKTVAFDFNEDGFKDYICVSASGFFTTLKSREFINGTQKSHFHSNDGTRNMISLAGGDFDDDNVADVVVIDNNIDEILFFENTATSGTTRTNIDFATPKIIPSSVVDPNWIESVDIDNDGDLDLIVTSNNGGNAFQGFVTVLENKAITLSVNDYNKNDISYRILPDGIQFNNLTSSQNKVALFDINGRQIRTKFVNSADNTLNTSGLSKGIYIAKLEGFSKSVKFLVD